MHLLNRIFRLLNRSSDKRCSTAQKPCKMNGFEFYTIFFSGEERWGTDEETFNRVFSIRDMYSLRQIYNEYVKVSALVTL